MKCRMAVQRRVPVLRAWLLLWMAVIMPRPFMPPVSTRCLGPGLVLFGLKMLAGLTAFVQRVLPTLVVVPLKLLACYLVERMFMWTLLPALGRLLGLPS